MRVGARGDRPQQEQRCLIPRTRRKAFAFEEREGCTDHWAEIFEPASAQRQEVRAVIGSVARDGAVRLHQRGKEVGRGGGLVSHCLGQSITDGACGYFRPGEQLQQQPMVV